MLYFRAIFDMATVVKMVADKVSPLDRIQMLTMLKGILGYLECADVRRSSTVVYEEPMVVVRNLIISIEKTDQSLFDDSVLLTKNPTKLAAKRKVPQVSPRVAVKRGPSPGHQSSDGDDYNDDYSDVIIHAAENATVTEEVTDWQPIDALQYAISSLSQDISTHTPTKPKKKKKGILTRNGAHGPKQYLALGEEYINPVPRIRSADGVTKWPKYGKWVCAYCRRICTNVDMFKSHLKTHRNEGVCSCRHCRKEILNAELLQFHTCSQRNKCSVCKKVFTKPSKMRLHMNTHFKSQLVSIRCKLCTETEHYGSVVECAQHVYEVHENSIVCDSCFTELDPFEAVNADPVRIYCQKCADKAGEGGVPVKPSVNPNTDVSITSEKMSYYQRRPSKSTPRGEGNYYCEACNFRTHTQGLFEKHTITNTHTRNVYKLSGEKPPTYSCSVCDKTFLTEKYRNEHFQRNHIDERVSLTCNICGKNFVTKGGLDTHMRYHLNLRDYPCPYCELAFNSRSDLSNHQQWKHTEGYPHKCDKCDEEFKHRRQLNLHMRVVHERLVFACPECPYECPKSDSLKSHVTARHASHQWTASKHYLKKSTKPYVAPTPVKVASRSRLWVDEDSDTSEDEERMEETVNIVKEKKGTASAAVGDGRETAAPADKTNQTPNISKVEIYKPRVSTRTRKNKM